MTCITNIALSLLVMSTHHVPGDYNERHNGLGVEAPVSCNTQVVAGAYDNSHNRQTLYAGASWETEVNEWMRLGGVATFVTGYEETPVMAAATARIGTDALAVRIMHVPATVTSLQLRVGF